MTGWQDENKTVKRARLEFARVKVKHGMRDDIILHKRFNHLTSNTRNHFSFELNAINILHQETVPGFIFISFIIYNNIIIIYV